jgi:membrane-associated phospholipid phosphatase
LAAPADDGTGAADGSPPPPKAERFFSLEYGKTVLADALDVATAPARWDAHDWRFLGYYSLALAVSIAVIDKPVRDFAQHNQNDTVDNVLTAVEPFGQKRYTIPLMASFYLYGHFADDDQARATALDGIAASFIANPVTSVFKGLTGRARPNTGLGPHHWRPLEGDQSFPSGHATQAFAMAGVITSHYPSATSEWLCYGTASLVASARIYHDKHWLSDVVAGGLVGTAVGKEIAAVNATRRAQRSAMVPTVAGDGDELTLNWAF